MLLDALKLLTITINGQCVLIHKMMPMLGAVKFKNLWEEINAPIQQLLVLLLSMLKKLSNHLLSSLYLVLTVILTGTIINTDLIGNAVALLEENNHQLN